MSARKERAVRPFRQNGARSRRNPPIFYGAVLKKNSLRMSSVRSEKAILTFLCPLAFFYQSKKARYGIAVDLFDTKFPSKTGGLKNSYRSYQHTNVPKICVSDDPRKNERTHCSKHFPFLDLCVRRPPVFGLLPDAVAPRHRVSIGLHRKKREPSSVRTHLFSIRYVRHNYPAPIEFCSGGRPQSRGNRDHANPLLQYRVRLCAYRFS